MSGPDADVIARRFIAAEPDRVWQEITDLGSIRRRSPETFSARWRRGGGPVPGARFRGWNRNGPFVWSTTCTVTEAEPGRTFAFAVTFLGLPVALWRWDVEPAEGGAAVALGMADRRGRVMHLLGRVGTGVGDRLAHNRAGMEETLRRLAAALQG